MSKYTLDRDAAIQSDSGGGQRITETGKYIGIFTKAKGIKAKTGADGLQFTFKSEDDMEADFLRIYTEKEGEKIFGFNTLCAIMTVFKLRSITATERIIPEYNFDAKKEVPTKVEMYNELMDKQIGVLLEKAWYSKKDGSDGFSFNLVHVFDPVTEQTAKELLEKTPAEQLSVLVDHLSDRDNRTNIKNPHIQESIDAYDDDFLLHKPETQEFTEDGWE